MFADSAIFHKTPMQVAVFGVVQLAFVLAAAYFAKRSHPERLSFARIAWLTAACLATSLPFAFVAYILWPWNLDSRNLRLAVMLAVSGAFFAPFLTAFVLLQRIKVNGAETHTRP